MPINFHDGKNRASYASREADAAWMSKISELVEVTGKHVLDIGCGGGIYTKALAAMGAEHVTGVDYSDQILRSAKDNCRSYENAAFMMGNALHVPLPDQYAGLILERALIHHIRNLDDCFREVYRLLEENGTAIIQDRTPEDCLLEGSETHLRGYFFSCYPELTQAETARRHSGERVQASLRAAGFRDIEEHSFWETRMIYPNTGAMTADLLNRTGRSILHEIDDSQLEGLVQYMKEQIGSDDRPIIEQDRWTIWRAVK
jgi:ubiquinone/menaquinone biosynthesis C-methylase UbiE